MAVCYPPVSVQEEVVQQALRAAGVGVEALTRNGARASCQLRAALNQVMDERIEIGRAELESFRVDVRTRYPDESEMALQRGHVFARHRGCRRGHRLPRGPGADRAADRGRLEGVLRVDHVGSHEDFFELGADSLLAIQVVTRVRRLGLIEPAPREVRVPPPGVLHELCMAFNAGDLDRLTSLLLDTAVVEVVGATTQYGPEAARHTLLNGMLFGSGRMATADVNGGIDGRFIVGVLSSAPRVEAREQENQKGSDGGRSSSAV